MQREREKVNERAVIELVHQEIETVACQFEPVSIAMTLDVFQLTVKCQADP